MEKNKELGPEWTFAGKAERVKMYTYDGTVVEWESADLYTAPAKPKPVPAGTKVLYTGALCAWLGPRAEFHVTDSRDEHLPDYRTERSVDSFRYTLTPVVAGTVSCNADQDRLSNVRRQSFDTDYRLAPPVRTPHHQVVSLKDTQVGDVFFVTGQPDVLYTKDRSCWPGYLKFGDDYTYMCTEFIYGEHTQVVVIHNTEVCK